MTGISSKFKEERARIAEEEEEKNNFEVEVAEEDRMLRDLSYAFFRHNYFIVFTCAYLPQAGVLVFTFLILNYLKNRKIESLLSLAASAFLSLKTSVAKLLLFLKASAFSPLKTRVYNKLSF